MKHLSLNMRHSWDIYDTQWDTIGVFWYTWKYCDRWWV